MDDDPEHPVALECLRRDHEELLKRMADGFTTALRQGGWSVAKVLPQARIHPEVVQTMPGRVAYVVVDAMRYEMGAELARHLALDAEVEQFAGGCCGSIDVDPIACPEFPACDPTSLNLVDNEMIGMRQRRKGNLPELWMLGADDIYRRDDTGSAGFFQNLGGHRAPVWQEAIHLIQEQQIAQVEPAMSAEVEAEMLRAEMGVGYALVKKGPPPGRLHRHGIRVRRGRGIGLLQLRDVDAGLLAVLNDPLAIGISAHEARCSQWKGCLESG
jgi:hypothetical protein